jgi:hypothetical protein
VAQSAINLSEEEEDEEDDVGVEQWTRIGPSLLEIAAPVLRHKCPKEEEEEEGH